MPPGLEWIPQVVFPLAVLTMSVLTAGHALLRKRHSRSAAGWIALCIFFPLVGPALYWLLGQNRIYTRAAKMRGEWPTPEQTIAAAPASRALLECVTSDKDDLDTLLAIARAGDAVTRRALVGGNRLTALHDGDEAYPAMLGAIEDATSTVFLCTYIFEGKRVLASFGGALERAAERGVDVRVLIDGVGEFYGRPRVGRYLSQRGVRVARFLPPSLTLRGVHINLRNHRKILVVDHGLGFTGGMNLRDGHVTRGRAAKHSTRDLHFQVEGPIVGELTAAFLEDWGFATGRQESVPAAPASSPAGNAVCRAVQDGPNEDFEALYWSILAAVSAARREVLVVTPYFIPPRELVAALSTAALSGVSVRVLVPAASNLPVVDWATRAMLPELLARGVRVALQPPPFPHTKFLVVDRLYSSIGSANLDPRSLRLNFEFNLEVHDRALAEQLAHDFDLDWAEGAEIHLDDLTRLSLPIQIRNNLARLLEPYL